MVRLRWPISPGPEIPTSGKRKRTVRLVGEDYGVGQASPIPPLGRHGLPQLEKLYANGNANSVYHPFDLLDPASECE
jgi:hypothetical protein